MKTVAKYQKIIKGGLFTEKDLIYFRKYINGNAELFPSQWRLLTDFEKKAQSIGIKLTSQQQVKGLLWLKEKTFKLNGNLRSNSPCGEFEANVIKRFKSFKCVGLHNLSQNEYRQYVPIYRCIATNGCYFDYICKMWGEIEVIYSGNNASTKKVRIGA